MQPNGRIRGYFISFQNDKSEFAVWSEKEIRSRQMTNFYSNLSLKQKRSDSLITRKRNFRFHSSLTDERFSDETEETYVIHRQRHYLHEKSEPDTGYKVTVWAETRAGEGPTTLRPVRTWPARSRKKPENLMVEIMFQSLILRSSESKTSRWIRSSSSGSPTTTVSGRCRELRSLSTTLQKAQTRGIKLR